MWRKKKKKIDFRNITTEFSFLFPYSILPQLTYASIGYSVNIHQMCQLNSELSLNYQAWFLFLTWQQGQCVGSTSYEIPVHTQLPTSIELDLQNPPQVVLFHFWLLSILTPFYLSPLWFLMLFILVEVFLISMRTVLELFYLAELVNEIVADFRF